MEITFAQDYLRELFYKGKASDKKHRFQPQIVRKLMESLHSTEDLYRFKALNYEVLHGKGSRRESVRINNQYRIEFASEIIRQEKVITICNILELSNHYK